MLAAVISICIGAALALLQRDVQHVADGPIAQLRATTTASRMPSSISMSESSLDGCRVQSGDTRKPFGSQTLVCIRAAARMVLGIFQLVASLANALGPGVLSTLSSHRRPQRKGLTA